MDDVDSERVEVGIMDVPEEIFEYILSLVSPYNDYQSARLVCKLWYKAIQGVAQQRYNQFMTACRDGVVTWCGLGSESGTMIKERYSHSACYHNKAIYVFGGCTATATTFNDLWRFDLSTRQWIRPLAIGTYPSPKACASLLSYKDSLILFGGWSHPTPMPLHQPNNFFNQLHVYSPSNNNWTLVPERVSRTGVPRGPPQGRAGHAASIIGDRMVVFGGSQAHSARCQDVWVLDLLTMEWDLICVLGPKPQARFGHSQVVLDDRNILIIGGCAGPNMQFNDAWLLKMDHDDWWWREVTVLGLENSPPKLWCHPACKVGDNVIVLSQLNSRSPRLASLEAAELSAAPSPTRPLHVDTTPRRSQPKRSAPETSESSSQESSSDNEDRIMNGTNERLVASANRLMEQPSTSRPNRLQATGQSAATRNISEKQDQVAGPSNVGPNEAPSEPHTLAVREGKPSIRPNAMKNRQKQLEALRRHELRIHCKVNNPSPPNNQHAPALKRTHQQGQRVQIHKAMFVHTLNVSQAILLEEVRWLDVGVDYEGFPAEEKMFYSLVHGRGELIMFGGITSEMQAMQQGTHHLQTTSNSTHFITAKPKLRVTAARPWKFSKFK